MAKKTKVDVKKKAPRSKGAPAKPKPAKPVKAATKPAKAAKAAKAKAPKPVPGKVVAAKAVKVATKPAAKETNKASAKAAAKVPPKETPIAVAKTSAKATGKEPADVKVKAAKAGAKSKESTPKPAAPQDAFPALEGDVKRPAKAFFVEVKPGVERVIKRGDKSAASLSIDLQARRKGPATEETPEELAERIERELRSQSFLKRATMRPQLCTKCGINAVVPRFTIDRELGYCNTCAEILRLGETKEAKRMEFGISSVKKEEPEAAPDEPPAEDSDEEPVPDEDID
jgi:hypothetical protein